MRSFLHIAVLQYHLLVDSSHIREVTEFERQDDEQLQGYRTWRGNSIAVRDCRQMLGEAEPRTPGGIVVYGENEADVPVMLLCDKVCGLVQVAEAAFRPLPRSVGRIAHFVDGVLPEKTTGQLLFRMKQGAFLNAV